MSKTWLGWLAAASLVGGAVVGCSSSSSSGGGAGGAGGSGGSDAGAEASGGSKDAGKDSGTATTPIGQKCTSDTACGGNGAVCVKDSATDFLGGGPAHGYCSLDCTDWLNSQSGDDPCAAFDSACVNFAVGANDPPKGWCAQNCTTGPAGQQTFSASKCHKRQDVGCRELTDSTGNTVVATLCIPSCANDADCTGGRKCDPRDGVCVDTPNTGAPLGSYCSGNADAGPECAGACLGIIANSGDTVPAAHFCSQACVFGNFQNTCNYVGQDPLNTVQPPAVAGVCIFAGQDTAFGDIGYCGQLCDTNADCLNQTDTQWACDNSAQVVQNIGHGICSTPDPDAGVPEAGVDTGVDAGVDADVDAGVDAADTDAAADAAVE